MKRLKVFFWPLVGLIAVMWSLEILYTKLRMEAEADLATRDIMEKLSFFEGLSAIFKLISLKLYAISPHAYALACMSMLFAYWALAWYDRIALLHLRKTKNISWFFTALCSFVTYAIAHNIGGSVLSGGMVRYRAYTSKGLSAADVAILVALCSFTFAFGTIILGGVVLLFHPQIVDPFLHLAPWLNRSFTQVIGAGMLAFCLLYTLGAWFGFKPLIFRQFRLEYPRMEVVWRQWIAGPLELLGAVGIIYFVLPEQGNPGFFMVLGAFLLSFSAGLLLQVPGGIGVMEIVFVKTIPTIPAADLFAALLVWRLLYLLLPLALSIPTILFFERSQLKKET